MCVRERRRFGSRVLFGLALRDVGKRRGPAGFPGSRSLGFGPGSAWSRGNGVFGLGGRICTYRRQEGAAPLLSATEETRETRSVFFLQGTRTYLSPRPTFPCLMALAHELVLVCVSCALLTSASFCKRSIRGHSWCFYFPHFYIA